MLQQPTALFLCRPYKNYGHVFKSLKGRAFLENTLLWLMGELIPYFISFRSSCLFLFDLLLYKHQNGKIPQGRAEPHMADRCLEAALGPWGWWKRNILEGKKQFLFCLGLFIFSPQKKGTEPTVGNVQPSAHHRPRPIPCAQGTRRRFR